MFTRFRPIRPYLARYKKGFVVGFAALIAGQSIGALVGLVIKAGIDDLNDTSLKAHGALLHKLVWVACLLVGLSLVKSFFQFWSRWILIGISRDSEYDLRNDLFRHLLRLSQRYYTENRTGDLMSKLTNDLSAVRNMIGPGIMYSASTVVTGVVSIALMIHLDWKLTLMALAPLPLVSIAVKVFGDQIHERFEKIQALYSELTERVRENISGVRVVRAFRQEDAEMAAFDRMNLDMVDKNRKLIWISSFLWPAMGLMYAIAVLMVLVFGGLHVVRGIITVGTFTAFNWYLLNLIWPIIALGYVTNLVQRGLASQGRLMAIFQAKPDIDDREVPANPVTTLTGQIEFRNLSFSYNGHSILKNINLDIPAGKTVAIVGATGSGKSTLVSLIPRLYDAPPGTLLIDGIPVRQIPLQTLRENIGFVPQETFLFSETIRENIKLGAPNASDAEAEHAAGISNILPDINSFPKKFDTMVGERGLTLSGGQKQRTAISRAVIRNPRILILDDALSSVDTYTEETILRQLTGVLAGRTTILISHRVSTIQNADEIVVLHDGEIAERGTHSELLGMDGYYTALYNKQLIEEALEKEA